MKKSLVICGVAALVLASCTQSEVLDVNESRAIGFDAFTGKGTRAVEDIVGNGANESTFSSFYVYSSYQTEDGKNTNLFTGENVAYSNGSWGYSPAQYWQNGTHTFAAYSNGNAELSEGVSYTHAEGLKLENYEVADKDLIFATTTFSVADKASYDDPVSLTFSHLLSKVRFTFTNTFADNQKVIVSGLQINNSITKGTYAYSNESYNWTLSTQEGDKKARIYKEVDVNTSNYEAQGYRAEECYVLPQNTSGLTASFTVTVKDGLDAVIMTNDFTVPLTGKDGSTIVSWEGGNAYNYTAELNPNNIDPDGGQGNEITFNVDTTPWTDSDLDGSTSLNK